MDQETTKSNKSLFRRFWWVFVLILLLIILAVVLSKENLNEKDMAAKKEQNTAQNGLKKEDGFTKEKKKNCTNVAKPDPTTDGITWTLPDCASSVRLSLPADISDIFYDNQRSVIGFGTHFGQHIEGLDHIWIRVRSGKSILSWADGTVTDVEYIEKKIGNEDHSAYSTRIDYGDNLIGAHGEMAKVYVKKGYKVKRGEPIGLGEEYKDSRAGASSGEFFLVDNNRNDGVMNFLGNAVSPFDYLTDSDKTRIVSEYKKYLSTLLTLPNDAEMIVYNAYQPYLTNQIALHDNNAGKISGEWEYNGPHEESYPPDVLTFIETSNNPYFNKNVVLSVESKYGFDHYAWTFNGTFEINYDKKQIKIADVFRGQVYWGIFEVTETSDSAIFNIEYQKDSYPKSFSDRVLSYKLISRK
jgi:hypothetical protein